MEDRTEEIIDAAKPAWSQWLEPDNWPISAGQAIHESAGGTSNLAVKAKNFVGMKWTPTMWRPSYSTTTNEFVKGKNQIERADFVRYASLSDCLSHHVATLMKSGNYTAFRRELFDHGDRRRAIAELARVYATDPEYLRKLERHIERIAPGWLDKGKAAANVAARGGAA
jgi:flagellum-specific peptidoglycan hydrolase FlgJ